MWIEHFKEILTKHEDQETYEIVNEKDNSIDVVLEKPTKKEGDDIISSGRNDKEKELTL